MNEVISSTRKVLFLRRKTDPFSPVFPLFHSSSVSRLFKVINLVKDLSLRLSLQIIFGDMNQGEFEESLRETKGGLVGLKGEYLFQYVRGPLGALLVALLDPVRGTMTQRRRQKESTDLYLLRDLDRKKP